VSGPPNRDAIVIGVRLILPPGDEATVLVDVRELDADEFIDRHPADRALRERPPDGH
jgi:hypothetical protein